MATDLVSTIWFTLADDSNTMKKWGLLDAYLNPKPSYYAFQTLSGQLSSVGIAEHSTVSRPGPTR